MNRESRLWLLAAGAVAVIVTAVVLVFGISFAPEFPSLYDDDGPTIEGTVAYIDYGREECVRVLDVATGEFDEVWCADWLGLEGWNDDDKLVIHSGDGGDREIVVDPDSGEVTAWGAYPSIPPPRDSLLRASSDDGHATLTYGQSETQVTLIDVEGPRDYSFWQFGLTADESYAWACDSEDRLLVVAVDGNSGPWVVTEGVGEAAWK